MYLSQKQFDYSVGRSFLYSSLGHVLLLTVLVVLGWIAPTRRKPPRMYMVAPTAMTLIKETPSAKDPPPRETPKPTPKPTSTPKPTPKPISTPKPTPKLTPTPPPPKPTPVRKVIKIESTKKVKPTPKPSPTVKPTPRSLKKFKPANQKIRKTTPKPTATPTPEVKKTPPPAKFTPMPKRTPVKTPKKPAATPIKRPTPKFPVSRANDSASGPQFEDVSFPKSVEDDLVARLAQNFSVPAFKMPIKICTIRFKIRQNGEFFDIEIIKSTGVENLDKIALDAVRTTGRLYSIQKYTKKPSVTVSMPFRFGQD